MRIVPAGPLFLFGLLLAAIPLLHSSSVPAEPPPANPHAYFQQSAQCPRCHLSKDTKPDPGRFTTASIDFCLECHRSEGQNRTHPLKVHTDGGMRGRNVPRDFPLGDGEHIICLTCHTAHGPFVSNARVFPGQTPMMEIEAGEPPSFRTYFLRRSTFGEKASETLCGGCHRTL